MTMLGVTLALEGKSHDHLVVKLGLMYVEFSKVCIISSILAWMAGSEKLMIMIVIMMITFTIMIITMITMTITVPGLQGRRS